MPHTCRQGDEQLVPLDPEIDRTCRALRRLQLTEPNNMENNEQNQNPNENQNIQQRLLRDYAIPNADGAGSSILRHLVNANNFELKPGLIHMVQQEQFGGRDDENPNAHLAKFNLICDTIKLNGVSDDAIRLRLFSFSLRDKAVKWLSSRPRNSFTTWAALS